MPEQEFKLLAELRVTELKMELEKRSLDKNGIKIILSDRLEKAIKAEGHDPSTYKFCVSDITTPVKPKATSACSTPAEKAESVEPASEEPKAEASVAEPAKTEELVVAEEKVEEPPAADSTPAGVTSAAPSPVPSLQETKEPAVEEEKKKDEDDTEEEAMDTTDAPAKDEEQQLDDPLDDKSEPAAKAASAPASEKKDDKDTTDRSFWVRGLVSSTKAADLREYFAAYGKVARAKIFTSKKEPGKTFGLVTMAETEMVDKCCAATDGKEWNGAKISVEKGNNTNQTAAKTTTAANIPPTKKPEPIQAPPKEDTKPSEKEKSKEEQKKNGNRARIEAAAPAGRSRDRERPRDNRDRRPADRIAPSSVKIHQREPIRDSRRTISAARIASSRPNNNATSRSGGIRAPASMAGRLSRPGTSSTSSRRPESYSGRRSEMDEVQRMREELRLREADRQLEREREKLRMERERIEKEKLELQVLQQQQQLAALKANLEVTRGGRGDTRGHTSSSARDKYASSSSRAAPESRRPNEKTASRPGRPDDRRAHIGHGDRSRSRHDSRSHHDDGRTRHDSHARHETRHEPRHDARHDNRHEASRHVPATYGGGSSRNQSSYSSREAPPLIPGQNHYGSRDSYASASRDFDASRGAASGSNWGQASWAGLPTAGDGWGVRGGGNAGGNDWSSSAGYPSGGAGSNANIRIDYDKYRRQY